MCIKGHHHITNGEWEYQEMTAKYENLHYDCCHEPVEQIIYRLKIKRKPLFFLLYMIFPVCTVVFLSLLSFIIPPESGERVGFGVTILLTMGVYLMVISEDLPKTAHSAPLIGVLYVTLFYVMILGYVASTVSVNLSLRESKPPSILLRLARKEKSAQRMPSKKSMRSEKQSSWNEGRGEEPMNEKLRNGSEEEKTHFTDYKIRDNYLMIDAKIEKQNEENLDDNVSLKRDIPIDCLQKEKNNNDWRRIVAFLDKVFFVLFLMLIIISCCTILVALEIMYG